MSKVKKELTPQSSPSPTCGPGQHALDSVGPSECTYYESRGNAVIMELCKN